MDINQVHSFIIDGNKIEVSITRTKGFWESKVLKGKTGTSAVSGGSYDSVEDFIKEVETSHRYSYNFFNHGYKYAKANI